jgi:hypothetical protein
MRSRIAGTVRSHGLGWRRVGFPDQRVGFPAQKVEVRTEQSARLLVPASSICFVDNVLFIEMSGQAGVELVLVKAPWRGADLLACIERPARVDPSDRDECAGVP